MTCFKKLSRIKPVYINFEQKVLSWYMNTQHNLQISYNPRLYIHTHAHTHNAQTLSGTMQIKTHAKENYNSLLESFKYFIWAQSKKTQTITNIITLRVVVTWSCLLTEYVVRSACIYTCTLNTLQDPEAKR